MKEGGLLLQLTTRQMYELALQYMQWQRQTEGVALSQANDRRTI